ncbi:hypothetical protein ACODT5_01105 [Streptomyces sp. 5.8]|uniref:hypothetical protein n=1 Tax=Streptomyces sp. 5.8 TaxID=3406571 RepID=UPI003BB53167
MNPDSVPDPAPLATSDWLGRTVTDLKGRQGVVRRVYQVGAVQVAILTATILDPRSCPIWDEPLDLLARDDEGAAFPDYEQLTDEVGRLEMSVVRGIASEGEADRYRTLRDQVAPYATAQSALHFALITQVRAGDRVVDCLHNRQGTVLDPSLFHLKMTVRLDEAHRDDRWPDGVVDLYTPVLYPTLGLL